MTKSNTSFTGYVPENYDRYMGPLLFEPYAHDLVDRLSPASGDRVLEIACGTGIVTRRLRDYLSKDISIVATDLNQDMINFARRKFADDEAIDWRQADATSLPFADESFDTAVCQYGLMFFPDKPAAVREVRRVLKPGGRFHFNVWDALEKNDLGRIAHDVVTSFFDSDPPGFYQVPYGYHDPEVIRALLEEAGFRDIQMSVVAKVGESPSAQDAARGVVEGTPMSVALRERGREAAPFTQAVAEALAAQLSDHPLRVAMQAFVFAATK